MPTVIPTDQTEAERQCDGVACADAAGGLVLLCTAVWMVPEMVNAVGHYGWAGAAVRLFDLDAVVLLAMVAAFDLTRRAGRQSPSVADIVALSAAAGLLLVPHKSAMGLAATLLGIYGLAAWRQDRALSAAAVILVSVAIQTLWGRMLLTLAAPLLTVADAMLTAGAVSLVQGGGDRIGNIVVTASGNLLVIVTGCLSAKLVLQGWLCWLAIRRSVTPQWDWRDPAALGLLAAALVALNTLRLTLYSLDMNVYERMHSPLGSAAFELIALGASAVFALAGMPKNASQTASA